MSAREYSDSGVGSPPDLDALPWFARWRGLLSLSLGLLLAPTVALINQELIYATDMWACGHGMGGTIHIVPVLCLIVTIGGVIVSYRNWRAVGSGVEDEAATVGSRTRFLALLGIVISIFSSLVILAQWAAVFVFDPCARG
jgi:uncharacterized membrane protein